MANFKSISDVARHLGLPANGSGIRRAKKYIEENEIEILPYKHPTKYEMILKICPVCSKEFSTLSGHSREKQVCSRSCSNTYFRSGVNNPNWKGEEEAGYRRVCFTYHEKRCIICGEDKIVAVHHYDENHYNNSPDNLIPLCPTHHGYVHSKYAYLIQDQVDAYRKEFIHSRLAQSD